MLTICSGILLADYHVVRRYRLKLDDLYVGDASSIYWFHHGFNWRAFVAFFAGVWPLLRKLRVSCCEQPSRLTAVPPCSRPGRDRQRGHLCRFLGMGSPL